MLIAANAISESIVFMSDIIRLLPEHVANQIAAGEVVQRPASVVKELLDNSIDSGATKVDLFLKEAGKLLIQVRDNGKGMSPTDARMCWERHATSKIKQVEDLFKLRTMGFRGEALASIAAVAQVELKTKREEDELGTQINIEASEVTNQDYVACAKGTSILVKNLFYNVPARRNFFKSNPVETRHVLNESIRIALANPGVHFTVQHNDTAIYNLQATDLKGRIMQLFEGRKNEDLIPFEEETSMIKISGFAGTPTSAKKTRDEQFFFVNNRFIKDPYLHHAVMGCYEQLIEKDQFPFYLVNIEIDPKEIDVNIHPTKTEIKFQDERSVYLVLKTVIKKALGDFFTVPMYESSAVSSFLPSAPLPDGYVPRAPEPKKQAALNPLFVQPSLYKRDTTKGWEKMFDARPAEQETRPVIRPQEEKIAREELGSAAMLQLNAKYILTITVNGILIINQQAAHERVLFEKYLSAAEYNPIASQQKLFPRVIELSKTDFELAGELIPELRLMGFDVTEFGQHNLIVHGMPADMSQDNEEQLILDILADYRQSALEGDEKRKENLALLLSKRAGIKNGTRLEEHDMRQLAEQLFYCDQPTYTPGGKRTYIKLAADQIETLFK